MERAIKRTFSAYTLLLWSGMLIFAASNSVIAKLGMLGAEHLVGSRNPISFCNVLFAANIIAGITLYLINRKVWTRENLRKLTARNWLNLTLLAFLSGFLSPTLFFLGLMLTDVINVVLISVLDIPLTIAFSYLFFRQKTTLGGLISAILCSVGVTLIVALHDPSSSSSITMVNLGDTALDQWLASIPFAGGICVALATVINAFSVQYSKRMIHSVPLGIFNVFRTIVGGAIFFVIVITMFGFEHFMDIFNPILAEWMLFYGVVIISFGLYIWYRGLAKSSTSALSFSTAFQPIAGVLFAFLILGEVPDFGQVVGGVVILLGILSGFFTEDQTEDEYSNRYFSGC